MQEEILRGDIFTHARPMAQKFMSELSKKPLATIIWEKGSAATVKTSKYIIAKSTEYMSITWKWIMEVMKDPKKAKDAVAAGWSGLKHFLHHMWTSSKLLAADVRIAGKIISRAVKGRELSRREHKLLLRTGNDLLRLIPFSFFIIIPFMELLLPFALRLFPNLLPSTFQDKLKEEEKQKKLLRLRVDVAKFFQEVLDERAKVIMKKESAVAEDAQQFSSFLKDVKNGKVSYSQIECWRHSLIVSMSRR